MSYVTCTHCNGTHKRGDVCPSKPTTKKKITTANTLRNSSKWRKKSEEIRKRDLYLCQCCIRDMHGTMRKYEHDNLSGHHIIAIHEDETLVYDNNNLVTLCRFHHEEAEKGNISVSVLKNIVNEQENK